MKHTFDIEKCKRLARQAAAEGCVLLENKRDCLPLIKGTKVAIFGRIQLSYYKSGAGSGGMVNTDYVVDIVQGLQNTEFVEVDEDLLQIYRNWVEENPFDYGTGWAQEPRCQVEMPLSMEMAQSVAARNDVAIVILGRLAGEDFDHEAKSGSYYLTEVEMEMLRNVRNAFTRVVVMLNTGNLIDLNWMEEIQPDALLMIWQGGQEGGNSVADILIGKVNPSGRLCDTIAYNLEDYPAHKNFGGLEENNYVEDIYVGYRWFETFAPEKVRYPFGYGLSYTEFEINSNTFEVNDIGLQISVQVTNTGLRAGREVVQFYVRQPQGELGKSAIVLVDFGKTDMLQPGQTEKIEVTVPWYRFASYDDNGKTGQPYCYVLEAGEYTFFAGQNIRKLKQLESVTLKQLHIIAQHRQALAPVKTFQRQTIGGMDNVPLRQYNLQQRIQEECPENVEYIGDQGWKLVDVLNNTVSMKDYLSQLTNEDLACLICGEGMCSPKVTAGTAGAFGGVTERLQYYGIPVICCSDGPSGIRMDSGAKAFSHPCGTLLACTFDKKLNEDLFEMVGAEMAKLRIEVLLGPGMNLHRYPLNGRNFEYFSEDPILTGEIGAAQFRGIHRQDVAGCMKHFCANNQENGRCVISSNISERAIREMYLKGFEIAVKEGGADCIMTSYGAVNGIWTAGNYDLNTTILRSEWKFSGIVMTDWWPDINEEGEMPTKTNGGCMVRAQNDLHMVNNNVLTSDVKKDIMESVSKGKISRGQLARNAANICNFAMHSAAMNRMLHPENYSRDIEEANAENGFFAEDVEYVTVQNGSYFDLSDICTDKGSEKLLAIQTEDRGRHWYTLHISSEASELAQMPVTMFVGGSPMGTHVAHGTGGEIVDFSGHIDLNGANSFLRLQFGQSGMRVHGITFYTEKP